MSSILQSAIKQSRGKPAGGKFAGGGLALTGLSFLAGAAGAVFGGGDTLSGGITGLVIGGLAAGAGGATRKLGMQIARTATPESFTRELGKGMIATGKGISQLTSTNREAILAGAGLAGLAFGRKREDSKARGFNRNRGNRF